jgi:acyl dehydratase
MVIVTGGQELLSWNGRTIGTSDWVEVTQHAVNQFAELTDDHNWIHIDVDRATKVFGGTIVHGYFTLSLGPKLWGEVVQFEGFAHGLNYGLDKVRFPAPMPVGGKVRIHVHMKEVQDRGNGAYQFVLSNTFEAEGVDKPVCVAESVLRLTEG